MKPMKSRERRELTDLLRCLGDPTRLGLIEQLVGNLRLAPVSELTKALGRPQPTVSHHLNLLRLHGLVESHRKAKQVFYSLVPNALGRVVTCLDTINVASNRIYPGLPQKAGRRRTA